MNAFLQILCFLIVFAGLHACSMTQLTAVWKDRSHTGEGYRRIMVVGISDDLRQRKMFEDAFVSKFNATGSSAVSSLAASLDDGAELGREAIIHRAQAAGADAILVSRLIGVEERSAYVPPMSYPIPYGRRYQFDNYFRSAVDSIRPPGLYITQEFVRLENVLYDTQTQKMVWSAVSESIDPGSIDRIIASLSQVVVRSIADHGLIH